MKLIKEIEKVCDQLTILIKEQEFQNTDSSLLVAQAYGNVRYTLMNILQVEHKTVCTNKDEKEFCDICGSEMEIVDLYVCSDKNCRCSLTK